MHHGRFAGIIALSLILLLSGCVFYPRTTDHYDWDCDIHSRRLVLDSASILGRCAEDPHDPYHSYDSDGTVCLTGFLAVSAGSAIVSGSIVVVGNTVYWLEERAVCAAKKGNP